MTRLIQGRCEGKSRLGKNTESRAGLTSLMQGRRGGKSRLGRIAGTQEGNTQQKSQNQENTNLLITKTE